MGDYDVQMLIEIDAIPGDVRELLTSVEGIASWWSDRVEGSASEVGDTFGVWFPDVPVPFEFTVATVEESRIEWSVGVMPPPWAGTTIRFDLGAGDSPGSTMLRFEHKGFDPDNEVIAVVTPTWANIMMRLKANIEQGGATAFFEVA